MITGSCGSLLLSYIVKRVTYGIPYTEKHQIQSSKNRGTEGFLLYYQKVDGLWLE